jgi:hypothetical protein
MVKRGHVVEVRYNAEAQALEPYCPHCGVSRGLIDTGDCWNDVGRRAWVEKRDRTFEHTKARLRRGFDRAWPWVFGLLVALGFSLLCGLLAHVR